MSSPSRIPSSRIAVGPVLANGAQPSIGDLEYLLGNWHDIGTAQTVALHDDKEPHILVANFNMHSIREPNIISQFVPRALGGPHHQPQPHGLGLLWEKDGGLEGCAFKTAVLKTFQNAGSETWTLIWNVSERIPLS